MPAFMRNVEVEFADKVFTYPELSMEFEINFNQSSEGNMGHIRIYNLSPNTIKKLEKDNPIIIKAGYGNDVGTLLPAVIISHKTRYDAVDRETEIIIGDNTINWLNQSINKTWKVDKDTEQIASDIIDTLPYSFAGFEAESTTYPKGKTFSTTCKKALEELAADVNAKLHIARGNIYFREFDKGTEKIVNLNADTGLISTPEPAEKDGKQIYDVRSLLNYKIWTDSVVQIESKTAEGKYRVIDGTHTFSGDDFLTEFEVEKYD